METKLFTRILLGLLLCFSSVWGQDVVVSLKILPPYPTKITDYQSNPQMVILTVSNVSTTEKQVQLKGTIVGENGISISVKPNYRSSSPLTLAAGATVSLNGNALANIFDFNQLLYTGITAQEAIRKNGLPEGFYTVCVDAYDYNNLSVKLSTDGGMSCSALNISNVEPPTIIAPFNTQVLNNNGVQAFPITWSTPPGSPPTLQYTVKIVEILGNRNPNDAMLTTRPIYEREVMTNTVIYGPTDYQLVEGRSYAIMVTAKDPFDKVTFRNQGRSEVYMFTYGQKKVEEPISAPLIAQGGRVLDCNCKTNVANQSAMDVRNKTAQEIGTVKIGEFDLVLKNLVSANANGLTGSGSIKLPTFLSSVPVLVTFKDLRINAAKQVISGQAIAALSDGAASLLPTYDPNQPNSTLNTSQLSNFKNQMADPQKLFKNLNPLDQIGYKLPLGIDKTIGNKKTVLSITQMVFDAHQAVFDAGFVLDMPDATPNIAALGASNICFNKSGLCGPGRLYLAEDLTLNLAGSDIALKAKKNGALPTDSGTYVVFDQQGFSRLRIQGEYSFSQSLIKTNGGGVAKATIVADAVSWTDWIASVTLPAFQMANNTDFVFKPNTLFYDHSDTRNPYGLSADYQEGKASQWRGFFAPSLQVELPAVLKQGNNNALSIKSQNLIIDDRGVTGNLAASPVFTLGNGSLATWSCSLDLVEINFKYNAFVNGKLKGKVLLPFTDQQKASSQLVYSSTISSDQSGLKYNFTIEQANTLEVPMWMARFRLDNSSIVVNAGAGIETNAMLTMNGSLSIVTKMPVVGNVDFDLVSFKDLKFGTSAPYFSEGTATFGQSSPPKFVGGFPITLSKAPSLATGAAGEVGLHFPIAINLADMASLPKAEVAFSVFGKFAMNNGKVNFGFSRVRADSITVDGKLASFTVNGKLGFFENDQKWGNGVDGFLKVGFFTGLELTARGLFGKRDYNYWFLDARLNLPTPGIVVGPGISLFGFGGGAYYNLTPNTDPKRAVSYTYAADQVRSLYSPNKGSLGFKAGINLGTSDGTMLLLMGDLEAVFNYEHFAMQKLVIKSTGAMFAPPPGFSNLDNAMAKAGADIVYDFQHSIFSAKASVDINYQDIIKAHSELSILSAPDGWHFKIGDAATKSTWTSVEMMKIFRGAFYMNVGNKDMSYSPRMQELMSKIFPGGNTDKPSGLFFGAEQKLVDIDLEFLIFYLKLTAGFDFDVALLNTRGSKIECDGRTNIGLDGYYAMGRAEAYVSGEFGLFVDVWFFEGKVCAGRLGVKAGMEVGLPNPTWLAGWVEADYSVLGGAISGKMRFKANVGTKCTVAVNPFAGLPIISELKPANNEKKVSILSDMTAALNYYVNREFEVATTDEEGNNRNLKFKAVIKSITLNGGSFSANYTNTVNDITGGNAKLVLKRDKEAIFYGWEEALPANTKMELVVVAEGYQWQNNKWVLIAGSAQEERASFTTGTCPKTFENTADGVQIVVGSYPFKGQQFFTPKHENKGYIWLKLALPCLATSNQGAVGSSKTLAVFRSLTDTIEVPVNMEGNKITYPIPPNLKPSTMYRMQIVHRISPPSMGVLAASLSNALIGQSNIAQSFVSNPNFASSSSANNAPTSSALNNAAVGVQVNQNFQQSFTATQQLTGGSTIKTAVSNASSNMRTKEEVMYTLYFKTSKYQSLEEKVNAFNVSRKINSEAMNLANFDIRSSEEFDEFELHGWNYPGATANYIIAPLLEFREKLTTNTWINKHVRDVSGHFHGLARFAEFPVGTDFNVDIRPKINEAYFWDPTQYAIAQVRMNQRNITAPVAQKKALTLSETKDFEQKLNPYRRLIDVSASSIASSVAVQSSALRAVIR